MMLSKVIGGHTFEIDFTYNPEQGIDTVTLQCWTCDKTGEDIMVHKVQDHDTVEALTILNDFAEWHSEVFTLADESDT